MCLTLADNKTKSEIAENDIIVYKYLYKREDYYLTPYKYFKMKLGKLYKSRLRKSYGEILNGLHSFVDLNECIDNAKNDRDDLGQTVICEFIIPKGAVYYTGNFGIFGEIFKSMASSRIIFNKELITL